MKELRYLHFLVQGKSTPYGNQIHKFIEYLPCEIHIK